jgi:hypothetical protein
MKKILLISLLLVATLGLASCTDSDAPLNETQQAEKYNMSTVEYKETKAAAARMNMTIEDHMKMTDTSSSDMDMSGMDHGNMNMSDDSSMIEDDLEIKESMNNGNTHMEEMHPGVEMKTHTSDEHM